MDELVCARCQPLEARVMELEAERLELIAENTQLGTVIAGLEHTVKKLGYEAVALRVQKSAESKKASDAAAVTTILETWRRCTGHPKAEIALDGKRAAIVRKARTFKSFTDADLCLACVGLGLKPFVVQGKGWSATGTAKQRYDDVKYALGDEVNIERCIKVARAARQAAVDHRDAMWRLWAQFAAQEKLIMGVLAHAEDLRVLARSEQDAEVVT